MKLWGVLLILLGAVAALVLICSISIRFQRKHPTVNYDERQEAYRGKAYGFGLIIGGIYFIILSFGLLILPDAQLSGDVLSLIIMAGILLTIIALDLYCMMTGALLPLNDKVDQVIITSYILAGLKLFGLAAHIWFHGIGMGDDHVGAWKDMIITAYFTFQAVIYLIAKRRSKREADEQ